MSRVPTPIPAPPAGQQSLAYGKLLDLLQRRQAMHNLSVIGTILAGAACTFIGQFLVSVVAFVFMLRWNMYEQSISFWATFACISIVLLPPAFLYAVRRQGSFLQAGMEEIDDSSLAGIWAGPYVSFAMFLLDIALIGLRLIVFGIRRWLKRRSIGPVDLDIAARAVATLAIANEGIEPNQLFPADERSEKFPAALAFLFFYGIADYSKSGKKVWICSDVKKELEIETADHANERK